MTSPQAGSSVSLAAASRPGAVEIRAVKVRDLDTFARETLAALRPGEVVPISPSRARAQTRNPNADPEDIGLLVAYQDGRCLGSLGLVPGHISHVAVAVTPYRSSNPSHT